MTAAGKVVLLTGATSGIGRVAARELAAREATVLFTGRDAERGAAVQEAVRRAHPGDAGAFYQTDFADRDAVRELAAAVESDYGRLDALLNNAGTVQAERTLTGDGVERTFAVNYVAPFLLTNALRPLLRESAPARVVTTVTMARDDSFDAMADGDLSDLEAVTRGEPFETGRAYVDSKLAALLFTCELAQRLAGTGVRATCFNPGWIPATGIVRDAPLSHRLFFRIGSPVGRVAPVGKLETVTGGAETLVHHALDRELPDGEGAYFDGRDRTDPGPAARDDALRGRLWEHTADLVDLDDAVVDRRP